MGGLSPPKAKVECAQEGECPSKANDERVVKAAEVAGGSPAKASPRCFVERWVLFFVEGACLMPLAVSLSQLLCVASPSGNGFSKSVKQTQGLDAARCGT